MSRFDFVSTDLAGLTVVQRKALEDQRGFLSRFYCAEEFSETGMTKPIAQINHTLTNRIGAVRGMHFQYPPHAETKLVSCLQGEIFDVAVDLRCDSPTFLQWHGEVLSTENRKSLLIPEGFAHGFLTLSKSATVVYLTSTLYSAEHDAGILWNSFSCEWGGIVNPILSERDSNFPTLSAFINPQDI